MKSSPLVRDRATLHPKVEGIEVLRSLSPLVTKLASDGKISLVTQTDTQSSKQHTTPTRATQPTN